MEKKCFKCGITKELNDFYKHKMMSDGHLGKCKSCTKKDTKLRFDEKIKDPEWAEKEQTRHRLKYHRLHENWNKNTDSYTSTKNYRQKYPEKHKAQIKSQRLGSLLGHNHHWSYNEEHQIDVIDLSQKDHFKAHRFIIYDQERMMYRNLEGVLLDTKEKHLKYIMHMINSMPD